MAETRKRSSPPNLYKKPARDQTKNLQVPSPPKKVRVPQSDIPATLFDSQGNQYSLIKRPTDVNVTSLFRQRSKSNGRKLLFFEAAADNKLLPHRRLQWVSLNGTKEEDGTWRMHTFDIAFPDGRRTGFTRRRTAVVDAQLIRDNEGHE